MQHQRQGYEQVMTSLERKNRDIELRTQTKHDFNHGIATVIYHPVIVSFIALSKGSAFVNYHLKQSEVDLTEPLI